MSRRSYLAQWGVVCLAAIVLGAPVVQGIVRVLPEARALEEVRAVRPPLTVRGALASELQQDFEPWLAQKLGFRSAMVRSVNDAMAVMWGDRSSRPAYIWMGPDGMLFHRGDIANAVGQPDVAVEAARAVARDLRTIQDSLGARGVAFLVVIAPSKARLYPHRLPVRAQRAVSETRRDDRAPHLGPLEEFGVHYLEGHALLAAWERALRLPMFTDGGAHWNHYAGARILEDVLKQVREKGHPEMPELHVSGATVDDVIWYADNDLGELLNRWTSRRWAGQQVHPLLTVRRREDTPVRVNLIGDSFATTLFTILYQEQIATAIDFQLYDQFMYRTRGQRLEKRRGTAASALEAASEADVVIVEVVEAHFTGAGYGWVQRILNELGVTPSSLPPDMKVYYQ